MSRKINSIKILTSYVSLETLVAFDYQNLWKMMKILMWNYNLWNLIKSSEVIFDSPILLLYFRFEFPRKVAELFAISGCCSKAWLVKIWLPFRCKTQFLPRHPFMCSKVSWRWDFSAGVKEFSKFCVSNGSWKGKKKSKFLWRWMFVNQKK